MENSELFVYSLRRNSLMCRSVSLFADSCGKVQEMAVEVVQLLGKRGSPDDS
jgi:hypothetical protein